MFRKYAFATVTGTPNVGIFALFPKRGGNFFYEVDCTASSCAGCPAVPFCPAYSVPIDDQNAAGSGNVNCPPEGDNADKCSSETEEHQENKFISVLKRLISWFLD